LLSVSRETAESDHVNDLISTGVPLIFFDRVCEEVETAKITTDDFESGYKATEHLIQQGCNRIAFLGISKSLSISNKRLRGYLKALDHYKIKGDTKHIILCTNETSDNYPLIKKLLNQKNGPNGIVASVENLTTPVYQTCAALKLRIPQDVKVVCFSNLETASILAPSLTTITQPAFEMGRTAATLLFKALEKSSFNLVEESLVIPSALIARGSTG
jgi:LacI family transcriptional regulator